MPQMSPLLWGTLFMFFSFLMIMMTIKMYYTYFSLQNILTLTKTMDQNNLIWKW